MGSILDRIAGKRNNGIPAGAVFTITQSGREKLQEFKGDAVGCVLAALETEGSIGIIEIAQNAKLGRGSVERLVPKMVAKGFIQYQGATPGEDY